VTSKYCFPKLTTTPNNNEKYLRTSGIWNLTLLCLMRNKWRERHWHTFEDAEYTSTQLQASFISSLYEWSFALDLIDSITISIPS